MSPEKQPVLLSPERLAEIRKQMEVVRHRNYLVTDYGEGFDALCEVMDHFDACHQQVATELNALQDLVGAVSDSTLFDAFTAAATRLGIDFSTPASKEPHHV